MYKYRVLPSVILNCNYCIVLYSGACSSSCLLYISRRLCLKLSVILILIKLQGYNYKYEYAMKYELQRSFYSFGITRVLFVIFKYLKCKDKHLQNEFVAIVFLEVKTLCQ